MMNEWFQRAQAFRTEAHKILSINESAKSRVVTLEKTYSQLAALTLKQDDLFKQALTCLEKECYRAAHVMAWAAFMDFMEEKLLEDNGVALATARPAWTIRSIDDLRDIGSEYQIIEAAKSIRLCSKTEMKALHGLLNRRNECAHPSSYYPDLNETLGFVSEVIQRLATLQKRKLSP